MILLFRAALFASAVIFTYLFAETSDKLLLEVVRFVIPLDMSNAVLFNAVYLVISFAPILLFGLIFSVSVSGENIPRRRVWLTVVGILAGMAAFRIHQVWWVLRGEMSENINVWTESLSVNRIYFLENILPFVLVGTLSSPLASMFEEKASDIFMYSAIASAGTVFWLFITHKLQNLEGFTQIASGMFVSLLCGFAVAVFIIFLKFLIRKTRSAANS